MMGETCSKLGERRNLYKILIKNLKEQHHFRDAGVDRRVILK
jgi:hypothetical protein